MLRMESETGWWLTTHPDYARLAGTIAAAWGNSDFRKPEPREHVLLSITSQNDNWAERDAHPATGGGGRPAAFSIDLAARQAAFEEIGLRDFLDLRDQAARSMAEKDAYAALMIALHTHSLLTERIDRSTVMSEDLIVLDEFLEKHSAYQDELRSRIAADESLSAPDKEEKAILESFHFLQACDTLALLACVAYASPANLLHPLPLNNGDAALVKVLATGTREFRLHPWPFAEEALTLQFPSRHVKGKLFISSEDLEKAYDAAPVQQLSVKLTP